MVPEDVTAHSFPVVHITDPRSTVSAGASTAGTSSDYIASSKDIDLTTGGSTMLDAEGVTIRPKSMSIAYGAGGMDIDEEGIHTEGQINQRKTTSKGMTAESGLFGILPKTAVTFWAADYDRGGPGSRALLFTPIADRGVPVYSGGSESEFGRQTPLLTVFTLLWGGSNGLQELESAVVAG